MKTIKGTYIVRADLGSVVNGYTFTDNDRMANCGAANDFMITLACDDIDRPLNKVVSLITQNRLDVTRARLLCSGAPGLQRALNRAYAAAIYLVGYNENDITSTPLGGFSFGLDNFGEWQDIGVSYLPDVTKSTHENYYLGIDHTFTKIFFDDYNLQNKYVGQTFNLYLELELKTAGVFDNAGEVV